MGSVVDLLKEAIERHRAGDLQSATRLYMVLLLGDPGNFDALHMLGVALLQNGKILEAHKNIRSALAVNPRNASALMHLGLTLEKMGRPEDALSAFNAAVSLNPKHIASLNNRGKLLISLGRPIDALNDIQNALDIDPTFMDALYNKGIACSKIGMSKEALAAFDKIKINSFNYVSALISKARLLKTIGRAEAAVEIIKYVREADPTNIAALVNQSDSFLTLRRYQEAISSCDQVLAIDANRVDAWNNKGIAHRELMQLNEAFECFERAISIDSNCTEVHINKGINLGLIGKFPNAWIEFEWREQKRQNYHARLSNRPEWDGSQSIVGKVLFVYFEQGLGDTIQFCRFLPLISSMGATVVGCVQNSLKQLLQWLSSEILIIGEQDVPIEFDYHISLLSIPFVLKTTLDTIPRDVPYLRADPQRLKLWESRIGLDGFKIGISWRGSKLGAELGKSFALENFSKISKITNVRLISLQKNEGSEEIDDLPEDVRVETLGADFDSGPDGFLDTAAVMAAIDLVITLDTSIAHVAGALGVPVWVILKQVPDWRWMLNRIDTPWYPSMTLYRQNNGDNWGDVFDQVAREVSQKVLVRGPADLP